MRGCVWWGLCLTRLFFARLNQHITAKQIDILHRSYDFDPTSPRWDAMASIPPPPADTSTSHNGKVNKDAYEDAYRRFYESLPPKERLLYLPCASHDDFINAMRKLEEVANKRRMRGGSRFLDRIARLSGRLEPFFEVVNIMIQSNPEYTALAWGALRFILQVWAPVLSPSTHI